ncbi:MAG TPA: response regulator transcription factor [Vicinamibacterales bacterium]|jgi:DNA-binding response OmpR family regulator
MSKRILVVEDDRSIARLVRDNLMFEGFDVECADNGADALAAAKKRKPDLVLLDLMLPSGIDGFELCEAFSQTHNRTAVIILTARGQREDRVRGLKLGADDYVVKPFALDELLARVHAVLRRTQRRVDRVTLGDTIVDFTQLRATRGTAELSLTDREFEILRHLAEHQGELVTRSDLLRVVWGYQEVPTTRTVDSFIFRLRHKIEPDPHNPKYIRTAHGDGYRLITS